jgi:hypothetical protein
MVIADEALARLKAFARGGGKVLFLGGTPAWISGRTIKDAVPATAKDFAWATVVEAQLPPTPTPPAFPPTTALLPQVVADEILTALQTAVVAPVVQLDKTDATLRVMKRRWKDGDVYLFFNEGAQASNHAVTLMSKGRSADAWNAETGAVTAIASARSGAGLSMQLSLQPYATSVIVVR